MSKKVKTNLEFLLVKAEVKGVREGVWTGLTGLWKFVFRVGVRERNF